MRKTFLLLLAIFVLVMAAVPAQAQEGSIVTIAANNPELTILTTAIGEMDPVALAILNGAGPLTVFAPTDAAFQRLANFLEIELEDLLADEETLTNLLLYHVVQGNVFASVAAGLDGTTVPTLYPQGAIGISVAENGTIRINNVANVVQADIIATNGIVHVVDQVVFPNVLLPRLQALGKAAYVRVGHFAPGTRSVDVWVDGSIALTGVPFGVLSGWLAVPARPIEIAVTSTGITPTSEVDGETVVNALLGPVEVSLASDSRTTYAAVGSRSAGTLDLAVIEENRAALSASQARVTVLHAIEDAPAVDVLANGAVLLSGLSYPNWVTADVAANTYDLAVVPSGSSEPVVIDLSDTTLRAGRAYFVAAVGTLDNPQVVVSATSFNEYVVDENASAPGADMSMDMSSEEDVEEPVATEEPEASEETTETDAALATLAETAIGNEDFTTLVQLVLAADPAVLEALTGDGPLTVFAPTNAAFDALFDALGLGLNDVITLGGADLITPVLLYHVIEGQVLAEDVVGLDGESVATLLGEEIAISVVDGGVVLNGSINVTAADVMASNGVIHVIDAVLVPQVTIEVLASFGINIGG